jgi:hypothetical protein
MQRLKHHPNTTHTVYPRYPLNEMMNDTRLSYQKELFLLGLHEMTTTSDISNIWSHYQVRHLG